MPLELVWLPLLIKIAATAAVVVTASVAAERAGPFWGALIACLPVSAGPAYVLLALEADASFVHDSARIGIAGNAATGLFVLILHMLAPRRGLVLSLLGAIAGWGAAILAVRALEPWSAAGGLMLNVVVYGTAIRLATIGPGTVRASLPARWFEMPLRALTVGLLVAGTVTVSKAIGPSATGLAVAFPISMTSLSIVLHRRLGGAAVGQVMANSLKAMPGLALALFVLAETAVPLGVVAGLSLALLTSCAWSVGLVVVRHRRLRHAAAGFPRATGA